MTESELRQKINGLPQGPGVYLMKDAVGEILYIGKARSLRKRVRSYLTNRLALPKIGILMSKVRDVDYLQTPTEVDALLMEAQLIRRYRPRYNQELKDDKSYPLIKITHEEFPRIHLTRNNTDKRAVYYGPYTDAGLLREAVTLVNSLFPVRKCQRMPKTACLYYHIGQCLAPCIKPQVKPEYDRLVEEVRNFLGGGKKSFMEYLAERMEEAAAELRFEDAQYFKEQIEALGKLRRKRFSFRHQDAAAMLSATLELKRVLGMEKLPEKIVCFDVSNIQGDQAVASRVSFYRELPDKMEYRRYKIRTVHGIDDYAMIREGLGRMLVGIKTGRETFLPDLIMIDGGLGHLHSAQEVLKREGFETTELIALAKRFETVYSARSGEEVHLKSNSSALHLLQRIRDEAHHFAISYHRLLKEKTLTQSVLDTIPGIGPERKRVLLKNFDSIEELQRSGLEQLSGLPGMTRPAADRVWTFFHGKS